MARHIFIQVDDRLDDFDTLALEARTQHIREAFLGGDLRIRHPVSLADEFEVGLVWSQEVAFVVLFVFRDRQMLEDPAAAIDIEP